MLHGTVPQQVGPFNPYGHGWHLRTWTEETYGKRRQERKSYYEATEATQRRAEHIVLFGSGPGESSS